MADIDEVRRAAMRILEEEVGGPGKAAAIAGMTRPQWVNLRTGAPDSKTGVPRGMRKATARRIEAAFGKPDGWMDFADLTDPRYQAEDDGFAKVEKAWQVASPAEKGFVTAWADAVLSANPDT